MGNNSRFDPEFYHSQQGVNLLFKKNIKILCDDSQSRKRRFETIEQENDENANCLPPKAKQRTDDNGNWTKRKDVCKNNGAQQDFSRFLRWAKPNNDGKASSVLSAKTFDSDRNVLKSKNMILCGPAMNRKQFRRRKQTKSLSESPNPSTTKKQIAIECVDEEMKTENKIDDDAEKKKKKEEKEDEEEDEDIDVGGTNGDVDDDDDECEDVDLKTPYQPRRKRRSCRSAPILHNVVFSKELILSKVPISKKKRDEESSKFLINAPIFLNADEYEKLTPTPTPMKMKTMHVNEEEESKNDCVAEVAKDKEVTNKTWAHKLFGDVVKASKALQAKKSEHGNPMKPNAISRESSIVSTIASPMSARNNCYELSPSPASTATTTTTTSTSTTSSVCKPSAEALEWRTKQIKLGKQTKGYLNFIRIYPDKDLRSRLSNNLCSTPDKNERIGKKRWGGKYKKWRKFLHKFDDLDAEEQQSEQQ